MQEISTTNCTYIYSGGEIQSSECITEYSDENFQTVSIFGVEVFFIYFAIMIMFLVAGLTLITIKK